MNKIALLGLVLVGSLAVARADDPSALYAKNCASCHGKDGAGHTRAGRLLHVKSLADAAYQKTFSDDKAFGDIKNGLKDSDGNDKMKPFAEKLSDDQIKALVAYVRTQAK